MKLLHEKTISELVLFWADEYGGDSVCLDELKQWIIAIVKNCNICSKHRGCKHEWIDDPKTQFSPPLYLCAKCGKRDMDDDLKGCEGCKRFMEMFELTEEEISNDTKTDD
jgi:hypothetical protein